MARTSNEQGPIVTLKQAKMQAMLANSFSRLSVVIKLEPRMGPDWWRLLGDQWSTCDNIAEHRLVLARFLRDASRAELDLMMRQKERDKMATLPEMLTVFRGCYRVNMNGLSWTLDRAVAEKFTTHNRYSRPDQALLLTGRVRRETCVLNLDRKESEIISPSVRRTNIEKMLTIPCGRA